MFILQYSSADSIWVSVYAEHNRLVVEGPQLPTAGSRCNYSKSRGENINQLPPCTASFLQFCTFLVFCFFSKVVWVQPHESWASKLLSCWFVKCEHIFVLFWGFLFSCVTGWTCVNSNLDLSNFFVLPSGSQTVEVKTIEGKETACFAFWSGA